MANGLSVARLHSTPLLGPSAFAKMTALRMLRRGDVKGRQVCPPPLTSRKKRTRASALAC